MTTPYQIGFSLVDPAQWGSADSRAIEDAMTLISIGTRPSEQLCKILDNVWSPFDAKLEDAVLEYVQLDICSDSNRRRLIAWFAGYVSRLVGMATGEVGNKNVIDALSVLRRASANGPSPIPASLGPPLRSLIFPSKTGGAGQELLVPAFAARAEPVSESRGDGGPIVVEIADVSSVAMRLRHVSGRVVLECYQAGSENALGQILLDFLLVKEALAWNGEAGQTDATSFVEPRLERCRSTTINGLAPTQRRLAALIDGKVREIWS